VGRVEEASRDLQTAMRLGSQSPGVYEGLGNVYGTKGQLDSALVMFGRAIELDPRSPKAHLNRAITYLRLNQPREAITDLDQAIRAAPLMGATLYGPRGFAHLQLGESRAALEDLDRAVAAGDRSAVTFFSRGMSRLQIGDSTGARADFHEVERIDPNHAGARAQLQALGG
jgi:tetratricopeptide (TPR) repeat protein